MSDESIGKVVSYSENDTGVTATIRLNPGWTIERIEGALVRFFGDGQDNFKEYNGPLFSARPDDKIEFGQLDRQVHYYSTTGPYRDHMGRRILRSMRDRPRRDEMPEPGAPISWTGGEPGHIVDYETWSGATAPGIKEQEPADGADIVAWIKAEVQQALYGEGEKMAEDAEHRIRKIVGEEIAQWFESQLRHDSTGVYPGERTLQLWSRDGLREQIDQRLKQHGIIPNWQTAENGTDGDSQPPTPSSKSDRRPIIDWDRIAHFRVRVDSEPDQWLSVRKDNIQVVPFAEDVPEQPVLPDLSKRHVNDDRSPRELFETAFGKITDEQWMWLTEFSRQLWGVRGS